jgi:hypothetical protein
MDDVDWFVYLVNENPFNEPGYVLLAGVHDLTAEAAAALRLAINAEFEPAWYPGDSDLSQWRVEVRSASDLKNSDPGLLVQLAGEWETLKFFVLELERNLGGLEGERDAFFRHSARILGVPHFELEDRSLGLLKVKRLVHAARTHFGRAPSNRQESAIAETGNDPLSPLQEAILAALDGKAMKVEELANVCTGGDSSRLYKAGLKSELELRGLIRHKRGLGWYRPDKPPNGGNKSATLAQSAKSPAKN